jgi:hypothetical protein
MINEQLTRKDIQEVIKDLACVIIERLLGEPDENHKLFRISSIQTEFSTRDLQNL